MDEIDPKAIEQMKELGGKWAAYQNQAMDSCDHGRLRFLAIGPDCTFQKPPQSLPDTAEEINWKYRFVGWANTETGKVDRE